MAATPPSLANHLLSLSLFLSLPLRFWVNLIKNPEFLFDINKSATVDSCLTVIAQVSSVCDMVVPLAVMLPLSQAYIDACSTSEFKYTKDTPSARLLYANEVKEYKEEVTRSVMGSSSIVSG